jgi:hypothetical protein
VGTLSTAAEFVVPLVAAGLWFVAAPLMVGASDPRLKARNPDHYSRLVRLSRSWGIVACVVGFIVARVV